MNEIRKNNEEEKIIIEGSFKISPGAFLILIFGIVLLSIPITIITLLAPNMAGEVNGQRGEGWFIALPILIPFIAIFVVFLVIQVLRIIAIKKSKLVVTNKRIYGVYSIMVSKKDFSYRLDEIDNVEMVSTLGQHTIAIQFSQGHGASFGRTIYVNGVATSLGNNFLRMSNLKNYKEVYEAINSLIKDHKNIIDVQTDIEMGKLDAENRKADALENVAKNITGPMVTKENDSLKDKDYIDELKRLKGLLDEGIITQAEFDQEKKEILENNHK